MFHLDFGSGECCTYGQWQGLYLIYKSCGHFEVLPYWDIIINYNHNHNYIIYITLHTYTYMYIHTLSFRFYH